MSLRITTLMAALAGALVLVVGAGAAAALQPPKKIDLTNPAAVDSYLTSIGVNPATVVRQVGLLNYAGPNCPGPGWNCTASTKVVQVSSAGGSNKFDCSPAGTGTDPSTNTCVIVQGGPDNAAQCKMKDTGVPTESQRCVINQDGARNLAIVDELIKQRTGPTQDATQTADVSQTATERNQSQIHQDAKQDTNTGTTQNQNIHQVALVNQSASGSQNFSHVHQNQDLGESGNAGIQNQNVAGLPSGITDCDLEHKPGSNPNACANVVQQVTAATGGTNESHVHQNIHEHQQTTALFASQHQEQPLSGIEAQVDQSNPAGVGTNRKVTHQDGRQRQDGPVGTIQNQIIDPNCCGAGTTFGGANNTDDYHQTAIQSASGGSAASQILRITGDTDHETAPVPDLLAPAAPTGVSDVCRISHDARNNGASTHFTFTDNSCTGPVVVHTECFSGEGSFCTPPPGGGGGLLVATLPSSATFGQAIAPPDFGEPSTFPGPVFPGI